MKIVLASKSPRRKEILEGLGVNFEIVTADTPEISNAETPEGYVEDISREKGAAVLEMLKDKNALVISADTVVVLGQKILGKPRDKADAVNTLKMLSGKTHSVITAVTLNYGGKVYTAHVVTDVKFGEISDVDLRRYVDTGEPMDKAGAYAVQGIASLWIDGINGCYFNVVGFPTRLFFKMLGESGINTSEVLRF